MAIIIETNHVVTKEMKQRKLAMKLRGQATKQFNDLLRSVTEGFKDVWQNPDGLTVQECFDAVGKDALELCRVHSAAVTFINAVKPNTLPTETPLPLTPNEDGTITVGEAQ